MRAKTVYEGVGDKYAARKWHIPDPDEEFDQKYQRKLLQEDPEVNVIHKFKSGSLIIKNPQNLNNIAPVVRGVISKRGDLYIQSLPFETHNELVDVLVKLEEIKDLKIWWKKRPEDFLTISRYKQTNYFLLGESNNEAIQNIEGIEKDYEKFISIVRPKYPQYKFVSKLINENLNESPDRIRIDNRRYDVTVNITKSFEVITQDDGEILDVLIANVFSKYHGSDDITHGEKEGGPNDSPTYREILPPYGVFWKKVYPGRLYFEPKVLTFWVYPSAEELKTIVRIMEKKLNMSFRDWRIEIYEEGVEKKGNQRYLNNYNRNSEKIFFIPISEYIGSEDPSDEERQQHLLSPLLKKNRIVYPGVGSRHPKYSEHRRWERAVPLGDNKNEKGRAKLID